MKWRMWLNPHQSQNMTDKWTALALRTTLVQKELASIMREFVFKQTFVICVCLFICSFFPSLMCKCSHTGSSYDLCTILKVFRSHSYVFTSWPVCVGELKLKTQSVQFVNILLNRFFFEQSNLVLFWIPILSLLYILTNCLFEPIFFLSNVFWTDYFWTRWSFWPTKSFVKTDSFLTNCYFELIILF